jgi:neuralized-like protein 4
VGVIRESDGSMHIHINGEDRGIATTGIPPVVYAVVDLYGQTEEVVITSKKYESPESNFRAPDSKVYITNSLV